MIESFIGKDSQLVLGTDRAQIILDWKIRDLLRTIKESEIALAKAKQDFIMLTGKEFKP